MTKKQHYMTRDERYQLEALRRAKIPITKIAAQLGFSRQTIYNELKRGAYNKVEWRGGYERDETHYSADKAQQIHEYNQTAKGRPLKIGNHRDYADFLESVMLSKEDPKKRCSPAVALELARRKGFTIDICTTTLYSYIDKGVFLHLTNKNLWEKSKKKKRGYREVSRIAHPKLPSIVNRPTIIESRKEYGHWEMDLIIGKEGTKPVLLTLVERKSRQELIFKLPDRRAATIRAVFDKMEHKMPDFKWRFKSITTDNGSEFMEYEKLRQSIRGGVRFDVYYCHSYAAWEKGSNENHNRMIRRWYPKGTDFTRVTKKEIAALQDWMNNYPRKILNWAAPAEVA